MQDKQRQHQSLLFVACGAVIISFSPVFVKLATLGPIAVGFYRMLFGSIILLFIARWQREPIWNNWCSMRYIILSGLLFIGDLFFWHSSIKLAGPGIATILVNLQIFILAFIGMLFFRERMQWRFYLALPLAIIGICLLVGTEWQHLGKHYQLGVIEGLLAALFYALFTLSLRKSQMQSIQPLPAITNLAYICIVTTIGLFVLCQIQHEDLRITDSIDYVWLISYAVACQTIGWLLISRSLPFIAVSLSGLFLLLQPTLAFIWDIAIFHRPTTWLEVTGALLALLAIYFGSTATARMA